MFPIVIPLQRKQYIKACKDQTLQGKGEKRGDIGIE